MGTSYLFSLEPTFTQGLIIGQLLTFFVIFVVLKYLFLDTTESTCERSSSFKPCSKQSEPSHSREGKPHSLNPNSESAEWLNSTLHLIANAYRYRLRDGHPGAKGIAVSCQRIEQYINKMRPKDMFDVVHVHAVDLGVSAPQISNAHPTMTEDLRDSTVLDVDYADSISISLSTAYLFNYPVLGFAKLPVSLTISLSIFTCSVIVSPPTTSSFAPALTLMIPPTFTLDLKTSSLIGSRGRLADVPKLHELITEQIRRLIVRHGTIKIPLPGLSSVEEVKEEMVRESAKFQKHV